MRLVHSNTSGHLLTSDQVPLADTMTVFIVDDRATARSLLEGLARSLGDDIRVECFADPRQALERTQSIVPDLVITDYRMPVMDGIEFTRRLRAVSSLADIPIVIITVVEDRRIRHLALESGATDFLTRPIDPHECRARCRNLLALRRSQRKLGDHASRLEVQIARATQIIHARERETLIKLARAGEYRDEETGNHIYRMAKFSSLIARRLGLNPQECEDIELAAPMHDLGKIGIPDSILLKNGKLDPDEWEIMKRHPVIGHDILADSPSHYLRLGALIALYHHERYDGSGYPHNLVGEAIPISARIVAVADVFDALTTVRPYKTAWTLDKAIEYLRQGRGTHFDPHCIDAFLGGIEDVHQIMREYQDDEDQTR